MFLNKELFRMKIVKNEQFSFCEKEIEDIVHFFYEREISRKIRNETSNWIYEGIQ